MKDNETKNKFNSALPTSENAPASAEELEAERKAMLYLLEDLEETTEAVTKAKEEWEASFDALQDCLMIHDKRFRIVRCNKAYQKASGMGFEEIIGKPYYEVFPKTDGPLKICSELLKAGVNAGIAVYDEIE
jgi:PAS domain-containing protein